MRVIIEATSPPRPGPFLPLGPRGSVLGQPLLQWMVESLAAQGCHDFHVVLDSRDQKLRALLGDGRRWGVSLTVYPETVPAETLAGLRAEPCLSGPGDCWPLFAVAELSGPGPLVGPHGPTGWLYSEPGRTGGSPHQVEEVWDARSPAALLATNLRALRGARPHLLHAREQATDRWVGRGARIHPLAELVGPVFIGADAFVGPGVRVGPDAVIGPGCILEEDVEVSSSVVLPDTYVGPGLELRTALAGSNRLYHGGLDIELHVPDPHFLGSATLARY